MESRQKKDGFEGQRAIVIPRTILVRQCDTHPVIQHHYITDIGHYPKARFHFRDRPDGASQHILIYCADGKGWLKTNDELYDLQAGTYVVIPKNTPHTYAADEKTAWTIYWVHFRGSLADSVVEMIIAANKGLAGVVDHNENRIRLFEDIYCNLENGYSTENLCYASLCLSHYLSSFLFSNRFARIDRMLQPGTIETSIEYMRKHLDSMLTLDSLAASVNLSTSHYAASFRKKTGFSPVEYFNHLKAQKACQYLLFTDLRIKEIAVRVGITDPYYFSRMFTKIMGTSPADYRLKRQA